MFTSNLVHGFRCNSLALFLLHLFSLLCNNEPHLDYNLISDNLIFFAESLCNITSLRKMNVEEATLAGTMTYLFY